MVLQSPEPQTRPSRDETDFPLGCFVCCGALCCGVVSGLVWPVLTVASAFVLRDDPVATR